MLKIIVMLTCALSLAGAGLSYAGKPDHVAAKQADKAAMKAERKASKVKYDSDHEDKDKDSDSSGLTKQADKKASQERKEQGKGSETGQAKRAEHSKKWWKFWESSN